MTSAAYLSLYIREGLPPFITEVQLCQHAAKLQQSDIIIDVAVRKIHVTGHCVGYAYITCSSPVVVQKTASTMNNTTIAAGYKLKVLYSTDKEYCYYCHCLSSNWPEQQKPQQCEDWDKLSSWICPMKIHAQVSVLQKAYAPRHVINVFFGTLHTWLIKILTAQSNGVETWMGWISVLFLRKQVELQVSV